MTVSEFMSKYIQNERDFPVSLCGDFLLAINTNENESPANYSVFGAGGAEITAGVLSENEKRKFVKGGGKIARTFAVRKFSVIMDKTAGDPVSDFFSSPSVLFGRESECTADYVFFNVRTGQGEKGKISADVTVSAGGRPNEPAIISADLYGIGTPESYSYS